MKNFKRKLAGFLIFAMVLGIMAPGVVAQAADTPPTVKITTGIEYSGAVTATASLSAIEGYTVRYAQYVGEAKTATGSATTVDVVSKVKSWETLEKKSKTGHATVDLSWCNKTKNSTVVFEFTKKGEKAYYVAWGIKQQPKAIKVALIATTGSTINNGPTPVEDCLIGDKNTGFLCFYTADNKVLSPASIWGTSELMGMDGLKKYMAKGKTFSFVWNGSETQAIESDSANVDKDGNITWPSKVAKFSYKKQANAPSVSFDVSKHTITIKKGQEYQVIIDGQGESDIWHKVDEYHLDNKKIVNNRLEDLVVSVSGKSITTLTDEELYSGNVSVKVRTAASTKSPSKIATVPITVVATGTSVASGFSIGATSSHSVEVSYTTVDPAKGVTVKNNTKTAYEVAVAASETGITATTKWVKLAKDGESRGSVVKLSTGTSSKPIKDPVVYVRIPGEKKTKDKIAKLSGCADSFNLVKLDKPDPRVTALVIDGKAVSNKAITFATNGAVGKASFDLAIATGSAVEAETTVTLKFTYADLKLTADTAISISGTERGKVEAKAADKVKKSTDNSSYTGEVTVTIKKDAPTGKRTLKFKVGANDPGYEVTIDVKNK